MGIGNKIKELRIKKGYSLQTLASLVGVSKGAIQQYEDGLINPSNAVLKNIAENLKVGVWCFYSTPHVLVKDIELLAFRDGHTLNDEEREKKIILGKISIPIKNQIELENILGEEIEFVNPLEDIQINNVEDVEKAVIKLRKKWKLGNSSIDDITKFLEEIGIKIIEIERETESLGLSGFIHYEKFKIPVIIINTKSEHIKEITRLRFTLLHELAHIILKINSSIDTKAHEYLCNRFASALLLPAEVLISTLGKNRTTVSLLELKELKEAFGISIKSIIFRANEIGLVDFFTKKKWLEEYNSWWDNNVKGFGEYKKSEEKPFRFKRLMSKALAEKRIDKFKATEISGIKVDKLESYFLNNKTLEI